MPAEPVISVRGEANLEVEPEIEVEPQPESEVESEVESELEPEATASSRPDVEPEVIEYSLFVPGPNGYDLVPQTGVPPQAGQTVELIFPDRGEPALFEVVRSGRTLPGGDVCVYLAQV